MNLRLTQTVCLLLILSSCKSLQHAASRDNSSTRSTVSKKNNTQFLNDVSITPGDKNDINYTYNKSTKLSGKKSFENNTSSSFNIEKADWLQIKYAIMMDMPVEQMNDLPLLQQIDHWWGTRYCMGGSDEN
ncbi:MAG TPA: hypothetical protein VGG71_02730, partial [Chitinophagaceae bacterium]